MNKFWDLTEVAEDIQDDLSDFYILSKVLLMYAWKLPGRSLLG